MFHWRCCKSVTAYFIQRLHLRWCSVGSLVCYHWTICGISSRMAHRQGVRMILLAVTPVAMCQEQRRVHRKLTDNIKLKALRADVKMTATKHCRNTYRDASCSLGRERGAFNIGDIHTCTPSSSGMLVYYSINYLTSSRPCVLFLHLLRTSIFLHYSMLVCI